MKRYFILFAFMALFVASCSDDDSSVSPSNSGAMFPTSNSSYWIFDNYTIDSNNVKTKDAGYDSMYVAGTKTLLDKQASIFVTISKTNNGVKIDSTEQYFYSENDKVYAHSSSLSDFMAIGPLGGGASPFQLPDVWMKIADKNDEDWKSLEFQIPEIDMSMFKFSGSVVINGAKGTTKNFTVAGKTVTAQEFISNVNLSGKLTIPQIPIPINFELKTVIHYYFANGIGLVDLYQEPAKAPDALKTFMSTLPGSDQVLTKYSIK